MNMQVLYRQMRDELEADCNINVCACWIFQQ